MAKILQFGKRTPTKKPSQGKSTGGFSFTQEVSNDVKKLSGNVGITEDEAIKMASDFYRAYPMLMEFVRSPEHMLRN